jgi:catechol 2,3-dioxygenase-like lactoylglutathione lyase family enzyme
MMSDIHHTSFTVSDMERSIAFYRDILGMKVVWDSVQAGAEFKGEIADNLTNCPGTGRARGVRSIFLTSLSTHLTPSVQACPSDSPLMPF